MKRIAVVSLMFVVSCSQTSDEKPKASPEPTPATATAAITAAEGGTVELEGAQVSIPAGAFERDSEVTLTKSCGGVFGALGLGCKYTLESESTLAARASVSLPADKARCAMTETSDGWRCLGDSEVADQHVTASTSTLTALVVKTTEADAPDDTCGDLAFTACGGDPTGEWEMVLGCGTRAQLTGMSSEGPDPYATCAPDAVFRAYPFTVQQTWTFSADSAEGGVEKQLSQQGGGESWVLEYVTEACLASVGETCNPGVCSATDGVCHCTIEESSWNSASGGSWSLDNGQLLIDGFPTEHCVEGDRMVVQRGEGENAYHIVFERTQ